MNNTKWIEMGMLCGIFTTGLWALVRMSWDATGYSSGIQWDVNSNIRQMALSKPSGRQCFFPNRRLNLWTMNISHDILDYSIFRYTHTHDTYAGRSAKSACTLLSSGVSMGIPQYLQAGGPEKPSGEIWIRCGFWKDTPPKPPGTTSPWNWTCVRLFYILLDIYQELDILQKPHSSFQFRAGALNPR